MNAKKQETLTELLGDDLTLEKATFYEVFSPDGDMVAHYDDELEVVVGHARVFFNDVEEHSETFLLELGRRAIEDRKSAIESRGYDIGDQDNVVYEGESKLEGPFPYYSVGIRREVDGLEDAASAILDLYDKPIEFDIDPGL
jgi:hypothetical protein